MNLIHGFLCGTYASNNTLNLYIAASGDTYTGATGTLNFGNDNAPTGITMPSYLGGSGGGGAVAVGKYAGETGSLNLHGYGVFTTYNAYTSTTGYVANATTTYNTSNGIGSIAIGGNGGTGTFSVTGGNLTIGTGVLTFGGNGSSAALHATIDATGFSTIHATTSVSIGSGSVFNLSLGTGFVATLGQVFTIISGGALTGTFVGLAESGTVTDVAGYKFRASYAGNAFTLTTVAAPAPVLPPQGPGVTVAYPCRSDSPGRSPLAGQ